MSQIRLGVSAAILLRASREFARWRKTFYSINTKGLILLPTQNYNVNYVSACSRNSLFHLECSTLCWLCDGQLSFLLCCHRCSLRHENSLLNLLSLRTFLMSRGGPLPCVRIIRSFIQWAFCPRPALRLQNQLRSSVPKGISLNFSFFYNRLWDKALDAGSFLGETLPGSTNKEVEKVRQERGKSDKVCIK